MYVLSLATLLSQCGVTTGNRKKSCPEMRVECQKNKSQGRSKMWGFVVVLAIAYAASGTEIRNRRNSVAPSKRVSCDRKLGLESGDIPDDNIMVSSSINEHKYGKENARLNGDNAWVTFVSVGVSGAHWIEVDLGQLMYVSGVQTQGQIVPSYGRLMVSQYKVLYKTTPSPRPNWVAVSDRGGPIVFNGNTDGMSVVTAWFPEKVQAQVVRIVPMSWPPRALRMALRLELLGCNIAGDSGCGGPRILVNPRGVISSMNYPGLYDNRANCRWRIVAPPYQVVTLTFNEGFALEYRSDNCRLEYVEILEVIGNTEKSLGKLCGDKQPGSFSSTMNIMKIQFMTDHYEQRTGFKARYVFVNASGCGGPQVLKEARGHFHSMNYPEPYTNNAYCVWDIYSSPDKVIQIAFVDMKITQVMRYPGSNCLGDSLQIVNIDRGVYKTSSEHNYCGNKRPPNFISISNMIRVVFHTNAAVSAKGFYATYQANPASGCGGARDLTSPRGLIKTRNYPDLYEANLRCEWIIRATAQHDIKITFHDFDLEEHVNCTYDIVSIYDGGSNHHRLGAYCNQLNIQPLVAHSGVMKIVFISDDINQRRGFNASYEVLRTTTTTSTTTRRTTTTIKTTQARNAESTTLPNTTPYDITTAIIPTTQGKHQDIQTNQPTEVPPKPSHDNTKNDAPSAIVTEEMGKLIIIGLASVSGLLIVVILIGLILCCRQHIVGNTHSIQGSFRNAQNSSNVQNQAYDFSIASTNQIEHVSDSFSHQGTIRRAPSRESRIYFSIEECPNTGEVGRGVRGAKAHYKKQETSYRQHQHSDESIAPFENEVEESDYYDEEDDCNADDGHDFKRQRCNTIELSSEDRKMMVDNILYESADSINQKND